MGVEPFLLSSSLLGVLAQRLVRKLQVPGDLSSDYQGRTGIFELLQVNYQIRDLIHQKAPESEVRAAAIAAGMHLMREDGERLVREGVTKLEEVVRVTRD